MRNAAVSQKQAAGATGFQGTGCGCWLCSLPRLSQSHHELGGCPNMSVFSLGARGWNTESTGLQERLRPTHISCSFCLVAAHRFLGCVFDSVFHFPLFCFSLFLCSPLLRTLVLALAPTLNAA